jgi:hypothetical protein
VQEHQNINSKNYEKSGKGPILLPTWGKMQETWGKMQSCATSEAFEATTGLHAVKPIVGNYAGPVHVKNDCASAIKDLKDEKPH